MRSGCLRSQPRRGLVGRKSSQRAGDGLAVAVRSRETTNLRSLVVPLEICWVLLFRGWFRVSKPLSLIQRNTFSPFQMASYTHSFGGLGFSQQTGTVTKVSSQRLPAVTAGDEMVGPSAPV